MTKRTSTTLSSRSRRSQVAQDEHDMAMLIIGLAAIVVMVMAALFVISDGFTVNLPYGN